jgi:hypothetical protein
MLTLTHVTPECRDATRPIHLCHTTFADEHTYRGDKRVDEKRVIGIEVP